MSGRQHQRPYAAGGEAPRQAGRRPRPVRGGPSPLASRRRVADAGAMEATRIVVGVDGSDTAQEALRWAVGLGETLGAEVVAVHAVGLLEELHDCGVAEDFLAGRPQPSRREDLVRPVGASAL